MEKINMSEKTIAMVAIAKAAHELENKVNSMFNSDDDVKETSDAFEVVQKRLFVLIANHTEESLIESNYKVI